MAKPAQNSTMLRVTRWLFASSLSLVEKEPQTPAVEETQEAAPPPKEVTFKQEHETKSREETKVVLERTSTLRQRSSSLGGPLFADDEPRARSRRLRRWGDDEVERLRAELETLKGKLPVEEDDEEEKVLHWHATSQDGTSATSRLERLELEWETGIVDGIEEPSLFLLAACRGTYGLRRMLEDMAEERRSERKRRPHILGWVDRCTGACEKFSEYNSAVTAIVVLVAFLTFLTIVLPATMICNFYWQIGLFDFSIPQVDQSSKRTRQIHRAYIRLTAACLLFFLMYTSLSVLDELKTFRFFLLGMRRDASSRSAPKRFLSISRLFFSHIFAVRHDDKLYKGILVLGIVSKVVSLLCVIQLTYLIFRLFNSPLNMLLNSVALQFILGADRSIVASLRNTPSLRRFYRNASQALRAEAEDVVATPGLLRSIVRVEFMPTDELIFYALSIRSAERLARHIKNPALDFRVVFEREATCARLPAILESSTSSSGGAVNAWPNNYSGSSYSNNHDSMSDDYDRLRRHRRACRSELFHRYFNRFVYLYAACIILAQIAGNIICSFRSVCHDLQAAGRDA